VTHARTCAAVGRSVGKENRLQIRLGKNSEQLKEVRRERELLERAYLRHGGRLYKKTRRIPEAERGTLEGPTEADGKTGADGPNCADTPAPTIERFTHGV